MKKYWPLLIVLQLLTVFAIRSEAGTIFYQAIPAVQSDANSGISTDYGYTSAVDGGNTRGPDRVINGITLTALVANGQTATADNCTLNALAGNLSNAGGGSPSIQADGIFKDAVSDMTFNNGATDNSQQEIVLDPDSLEAGTTYDLRIYVCNSSGQNRQVNLSFVGDGQPAVETGFFNEDDARSSTGGFKDPNQAYYINYRFTWDGDSTPGVTVTQKSGGTPFVLYALTNQVVPGAGAAGGNQASANQGSGDQAGGGQAGGDQGDQGDQAGQGGDEGLSSGFVENGSDEVGVESDDFYGSDSLNSNGSWIQVGKCKAWQPTNVASGWSPYTNGTFQNCDDCGATFVSDEPWAWACYHYGRWSKVRHGCGWAWCPGKVWAGAWVSWRRGKTESCSCIGWAPLPPEAGCDIDVGISSWVDETCNIGPECYTFINVVDFGRESYSGCGCIYGRERNSTIIIDTFNCTNICNTRRGTFCGGPDFKWCNEQIRKHGGKECENVHVNRYDDPKKMGGKFSRKEGNQLALMSPNIKGDKNHKLNPKVTDNLKSDKIDHGWGKDKKTEKNLRNHIAEENKGKNPKNTKATLPADVAQKMDKHHGGGGGQGLAGAGGGKGQHPGGKGNKGVNGQNLTGGQTGTGTGGFNQHPGGKGKGKGQGTSGAGSGAGAGAGGTTGFNQHPGGKGHKATGGSSAAGGSNAGTLGAGGGKGKGQHPGQSLTGKGAGTAGAGATGQGSTGQGGTTGQGGKHKGKGQTGGQTTGQGGTGQGTTAGTGQGGTTGQGSGKHKGKGQTGGQTTGQGTTAGTGQGGTTGQGSGKHKGKGQTGGGTGQSFAGATGQGGTTGQGSGKHKGKGQTGGGTGQGFAGATGQGGTGAKHKTKGQTGGQGTGQGQGSGGTHHNQQIQQQHVQQQHVQRQGGGGGGGNKPKPTPKPKKGAAAMSDLRVKKDISFVGWSPMGIPIYQFSYINQPNKRYQGTIAQAIIDIRPDAIIWRDGIMWVDYSRLDIRMEELPSTWVEEDGHLNPQKGEAQPTHPPVLRLR